jgi:S1-C subfamily serine protease
LLQWRAMKKLALLAALIAAPAIAFADDAKPPAQQQQPQDARLVPALRDGQPVGLKVYAIRPGGRFAQAAFENGDTIEAIDEEPVITEAGRRALFDKVVNGTADATVTVRRKGALMKLTSRAK